MLQPQQYPPSRSSPVRSRIEWSWQGHVTWVYKCIASEQNFNIKPSSMTTTTALKERIAVLVRQLELTKEAEKREEV